MINLDEYADVDTHCIALYVLDNDAIYLIALELNTLFKEIRYFTGNKNMQTNIFGMQTNNSVMHGYFCIGFID